MACSKSADIYISTAPFGVGDSSALGILEKSGSSFRQNNLGRKHTPEEVLENTRGCTALIAGTEDLSLLVEESSSLQMISRVGIGLDGVPLTRCKEKGIVVTWTPDAVTAAVAELTLGFIISCLRSIAANDAEIRQGNWRRCINNGISDSTIGLVGFGRIGKAVVNLLMPFCPKKILVTDIRPTPDEIRKHSEGGISISEGSFDQIIAESDIVSLHVPLWRDTKNLIGLPELLKMKPGSFLINTSRGGIVDESALYQTLKSGPLGGAALDVFGNEPYDGPLTDCENVILTPHSGSCSLSARVKMEMEAAQEVVRFLNGEPLIQEVPDEEYKYFL